MPYQGSAQSVGFRNRVVADPSKRMREEAAQLEERGRERIQQMETQASRQIREMTRVADIEESNTKYQLKALSQFSESLGDFYDKVIVEEAEKRFENQYFEDILDAVKTPEVAKQTQEEVDNAMQRSSDAHVKAYKFAEQAPTIEAAESVRAMSRHHERGAQMRALTTAGDGFGTKLIAELDTNETVIIDPTDGSEFKVNAPNKTPSQTRAALNYLRYQELQQFRGAGLSAKVIATKLLPKLDSASNIYYKDYSEGYRKDQAIQKIDFEMANLYDSINTNTSPETLATQITNTLQVLPGVVSALNPQFGSNRASLDFVNTLIKDAIKSSKTPEALSGLLNQAFSKARIPGHPAGDKSLAELYPQRFGPNAIEDLIEDAANTNWNEYQQSESRNAQQTYEEWVRLLANENPSEKAKQEFASDFQQRFPGQTELLAKIITASKNDLGVMQSRQKAEALLAAQDGQISAEQARNFEPSVREQYKDKIVDRIFGSDSENEIEKQNLGISNALKKIKGIDTKDKLVTRDALEAEAAAHKMLIPIAKQIQEQKRQVGQEISETEAIRLAGLDITSNLNTYKFEKTLKDGRVNQFYHSRDGFEHFQSLDPLKNLTYTREQHKQISNNVTLALAKNPNALSDTSFFNDPNDPNLTLNTRGEPKPFLMELAKKDPYHRSAYEILNLQREKHNLQPVTIPEDAQLIIKQVKLADAQARALVAQYPTKKNMGRLVKSMGSIDPNTLLRAIGFQESGGGDYQAKNTQSYGTSNPALGKYQILWKNVNVWGRQYGLGTKPSQQAFLDDPEYQERMASLVMAEYIRQSINASNGDMNEAIRRAAAFWYGGAPGFPHWNNPNYLGGAPGHPNMAEYTQSILDRYHRGGQ